LQCRDTPTMLFPNRYAVHTLIVAQLTAIGSGAYLGVLCEPGSPFSR
jgi:hypothetical protein